MATMPVPDAEVHALLDERGIIRTMHRYCRALDSGSEHEWLDIFTEDATYDTVLPDGTVFAHLTTRDEFVAFLHAYPRQPVTAPKHVIVDPIIEIDGDVARGESTFLFLNQAPSAPPRVMAWGRYVDQFRREGGVWRIAARLCETEAVAADA
ncbi:MAG: nuclear transport factor 2 family protein [Acidimicrobiales bacterium]